jgi:uncharacterized protein YcfJ
LTACDLRKRRLNAAARAEQTRAKARVRFIRGTIMKSSHIFAAATVALSLAAVPTLAPAPAQAIGCLSGGAAGAVAGHYAGHHAVLGAIGGCIAGHHMHKVQKEKAAAARYQQPAPAPRATPAPAATPTPAHT